MTLVEKADGQTRPHINQLCERPIKNFLPNKKQKFREIIAHISLINVNFMPSSVCPVFGTDGLRMVE